MSATQSVLPTHCDYLIVGAGSGGCVVANRLSADPRIQVVLVEAGGRDNWHWIRIPAGTRHVVGNSRTDWISLSEAEPIVGRTMPVSRGKVLGGSSSINGCVYVRGAASDFERWRESGLAGWGWDEVLPVYRRLERYAGGGNEMRGDAGELRVERPRLRMAAFDYLTRAAIEAGIPGRSDFNCGEVDGCGMYDVTQYRGVRQSAARAFLDPVRHRANLHVITQAMCGGLTLDQGRVTGASVLHQNVKRSIAARREVILCAGAIGTPQILQLSGIGPGAVLERAGVAVKHDLPGVGANLQDHMTMRLIVRVHGISTVNTQYHNLFKRAWMGVEYGLFRRGPLVMGAPLWGGFTRSDRHRPEPNVQFFSMPASMGTSFGKPDRFDAIAGGIYNLHPRSRGRVWIKNHDPLEPPAILHNYLTDSDDQKVAVDSVRLMRRIYATPTFMRLRPQEIRPGAAIQGDEDVLAAGIKTAGTAWHQVGTCAMGHDANAVVDAQLRVHGIGGLRVADGSVMPTIISGNTNACIMMIADRAATFILRDATR